MHAALSLPPAGQPWPGMVVLHEAYGLNDDIRRITARFAASGYASIAPDLYSSGNRAICLIRVFSAMLTGSTATVVRGIDAARSFLASRPEVRSDSIGVVGFCMGGGFALAFCTSGGAAAAGVNYGSVPKDRRRLEGACPIVASYGAEDRMLASQARRLEDHLTALGVPHDIKVYEGAGHSFLSRDNEPAWLRRMSLPNPLHAGYVEEAAEDAWRRMLEFFSEHLGP